MAHNRADLEALVAEKKRRSALPDAVSEVLKTMFPRQAQMIDSPHKRKMSHAGRRGGKTNAGIGYAFKVASTFPGCTVGVFERTLTCKASNIFWGLLQEYDKKFDLKSEFHHTSRIMTLANGSVIEILGADTLEAADKHRGGKWPLIIVDEAGTFRDKVLDFLLTDVIEPALMDNDGTAAVLGTPGLIPSGPFYQMSLPGSGWDVHHWTARDNPFIKNFDSYTAGLRQRYGWTEETPRYVREYLGLWAGGNEDAIYKIGPVNIVDTIPTSGNQTWTYALSMDLGFSDPTAFVVWARRQGDPNYYVLESYEQEGLIPSAVAAHVERLRSRFSFREIIADTGGYGKAVAEEMKQRFGIPVEAAKKRDKRVYLEHTGGDVVNGRIKIVRRSNEVLLDDMRRLVWNEERTDVEDGLRDHLPDAFLYGHRAIRAWWQGGEIEGPDSGSDAWYAQLEADMESVLLEQHSKARGSSSVDSSWRSKYTGDDD